MYNLQSTSSSLRLFIPSSLHPFVSSSLRLFALYWYILSFVNYFVTLSRTMYIQVYVCSVKRINDNNDILKDSILRASIGHRAQPDILSGFPAIGSICAICNQMGAMGDTRNCCNCAAGTPIFRPTFS